MSEKKYRKKPVIIEAVLYDEEKGATAEYIYLWAASNAVNIQPAFSQGVMHLNIETLEGTMKAQQGDWIIKGVQGEFYPCKPNIFEQTYEAVDEE